MADADALGRPPQAPPLGWFGGEQLEGRAHERLAQLDLPGQP